MAFNNILARGSEQPHMKRNAAELHVIEKGTYSRNLRRISNTSDEWLSGNWWISDPTAETLIGKMLYLHRGQTEPSHLGGEIISFQSAEDDPKRKVFRFRELPSCEGVVTPKQGWGNEKKIIWKG